MNAGLSLWAPPIIHIVFFSPSPGPKMAALPTFLFVERKCFSGNYKCKQLPFGLGAGMETENLNERGIIYSEWFKGVSFVDLNHTGVYSK